MDDVICVINYSNNCKINTLVLTTSLYLYNLHGQSKINLKFTDTKSLQYTNKFVFLFYLTNNNKILNLY